MSTLGRAADSDFIKLFDDLPLFFLSMSFGLLRPQFLQDAHLAIRRHESFATTLDFAGDQSLLASEILRMRP